MRISVSHHVPHLADVFGKQLVLLTESGLGGQDIGKVRVDATCNAGHTVNEALQDHKVAAFKRQRITVHSYRQCSCIEDKGTKFQESVVWIVSHRQPSPQNGGQFPEEVR